MRPIVMDYHVHDKSVAGQDATGNVAAQAALADDVDRLMLVQLIQPLPQLVHWDI